MYICMLKKDLKEIKLKIYLKLYNTIVHVYCFNL